MSKAVLFDGPGCIGCRACENACKTKYKLPPIEITGAEQLPAEQTTTAGTYTHPPELSAYTWIKVRKTESTDAQGNFHMVHTLRKCMHCVHPACVAACPVGALSKDANGATVYDDNKCIGCRYCMVACPFGVPTYQWDQKIPFIRKCIFCADLLAQGKNPACVDACSKRTKCITLGDRDAQIKKAHQLIADGNKKTPGSYVDHVYGEEEVGGTNWIFLSEIPFDQVGLRTFGSNQITSGNFSKVSFGGDWGKIGTSQSTDPVGTNAEKVMETVPIVLPSVAVAMSGLYWIFKRKDKLSQEKAGKGKGVTK